MTGRPGSVKILDWITRWLLKPISPPLCAILVIVSVPYVAGCSNNTQAKPPIPDPKALARQARKITGAEKLTNSLEDLEALCTTITRKLARNKTVRAELDEAKGIAQDLVRADSQIRAEFAKTRKVLAKIKSAEKNKIQAKVERDYASKMRKTQAMVATLTKEKTRAGLIASARGLGQFIDSVTPEPPHQPLGTELPHRVVDYHAGPPTLGTQIAPAYAPNTPNAEPSNLPRTPTSADTSETIEIQFTEDISKTANDLGQDPVKMYEFVRNTIGYEPYYGSRKGAGETLLEKGGNDFDQASLLIALFRYSGIPARYVQGVVDVPIAKAMNWVGVEKPEVAAKMFSAGGVPSQAIISGGRISAIRLEHVWTEVYVNYENYRGAEAGPGKKQWISLDPSFKQYEPDTRPALPAELLSFDMDAYLRQPPSPNPAEQFVSRIATYLAEHSLDTTITELTADRKIAARSLGLLPPTLSVKTFSISSEYDALPDGLREKLTLAVDGGPSGTCLSKAVSIPEVAGKSITLGFEPATTSDAELAMNYLSPYLTPAYLLAVKPVIRADGEMLAEGEPLAYGQTYNFKRTYRLPQGTTSLTNIVTAGSDYALALDVGRVSKSLVDKKARELEMPSELEDVRQVLQTKDPAPEIVYLPVLAYYSALDELNRQSRRLMNVADTRMTSEGLACLDTSVTSTFGVPLAVTPSSFYLDIKRDDSVPAAANGDAAKTRDYVTLSGLTGSHLEHASIEAIFGSESISAVKLMQIATEQGIPLRTLTGATQAEVDLLATSAQVKSDIRNALAQGNEVIVPAGDLIYKDWHGIAYIVRDPETASAGYMISSSLAGGRIVTVVLAGGVAGFLALRFFEMFFRYFESTADDYAYSCFWLFWCLNQRKPLVSKEEFPEKWLGCARAYEAWKFAMTSDRCAEQINCTDLLTWSLGDVWIGLGVDPIAQASPLVLPDTNADGLGRNQIVTRSQRIWAVLMGAPVETLLTGYFPYTRGVVGEWRRGDIMSSDWYNEHTKTEWDPDGIYDHSIIYMGESPEGRDVYFEASAAERIRMVWLFDGAQGTPYSDSYAVLDRWKNSPNPATEQVGHFAWTYLQGDWTR